MRIPRPTSHREFEARQSCLEFGALARFVMATVSDAAKSLRKWAGDFLKKAAPVAKKVHQLVLELDELAQIPLFKGNSHVHA